jgi:hypothetical protein
MREESLFDSVAKFLIEAMKPSSHVIIQRIDASQQMRAIPRRLAVWTRNVLTFPGTHFRGHISGDTFPGTAHFWGQHISGDRLIIEQCISGDRDTFLGTHISGDRLIIEQCISGDRDTFLGTGSFLGTG